MPELFRRFGFVFLFFVHEHEPIHVHVKGNGGDAKFNWNGSNFSLEYSRGIKENDLIRITKARDENSDIIVKRWKELLGETYGQDSENMV